MPTSYFQFVCSKVLGCDEHRLHSRADGAANRCHDCLRVDREFHGLHCTASGLERPRLEPTRVRGLALRRQSRRRLPNIRNGLLLLCASARCFNTVLANISNSQKENTPATRSHRTRRRWAAARARRRGAGRCRRQRRHRGGGRRCHRTAVADHLRNHNYRIH